MGHDHVIILCFLTLAFSFSSLFYRPGSWVQIASELEELKIQLQTKDMVIRDLERELRENIQQKQKVIDLACLDFT